MKKSLIILFLILSITMHSQAIRLDYQKHIVAGMLVGGSVTSILQHYNVKNAWLYGIAASLSVGVIKELYDKQSKTGECDAKDALYTGLGGICASYVVKFSIPNNYKKLIKK